MRKNRKGYVLYAIGEIILVVVGILIAIQIDNWNEDRKSKILEKEYLSRLLEDIHIEDAYVQSFIVYNKAVLDFAYQSINYFDNNETAKQNTNKALIAMYMASQIIDPATTASTYNELNSSGQINILSDNNLRSSIISYYELDWSNSVIFKLPNNYRSQLRSIMPTILQKEIRANCGDVYVRTNKTIHVKMSNQCEIYSDKDFAAAEILKLITNEPLKENLNFLIGNLESQLSYMYYVQEILNALKNELEEFTSRHT